MKPIFASAALAAAILCPAAFAQEPPPAPDTPAEAQAAHANPVILQGTPEAAAAAKADADRQSVQLVTATNNGEPVAAAVAKVVQSGKPYTTDDLVRAQRIAMDLDPGAPRPAARTPENTTKSPGPNSAVFSGAVSTGAPTNISATDADIPAKPDEPTTAQNTAPTDQTTVDR